jgi:hypothetical protein
MLYYFLGIISNKNKTHKMVNSAVGGKKNRQMCVGERKCAYGNNKKGGRKRLHTLGDLK